MTSRGMLRLAVLATPVLLFSTAADTYAQSWVPVGPPGGDVRSLAADPRDPRRIYLGTADGVLYRSDDAGLRWQRMSPGFPRRGVSLDDLVVDPRGVLLVGFWEVGGAGGGVARSVDGGRTFLLLEGIAGQSVRSLAVARTNPEVLVAGTVTGVLRSLDGGRSWRRITPEGHPNLRNVGSITIDPTDSQVIYAGTWHLPWKTTDGGRLWQPVHAGMIDDSDVMTLTVDRWNPQVVYATACSGVYRSPDAAVRWSRIRGIPYKSRRTRAFAQSADDMETLYAGTVEGLWMSQDGSATWRLATRDDLVVNAVLALPGGVVLLGTEGAGVVRSADGGRTWLASNQGFSERFVSRVTYDPTGRRLLAAIWGDRRHGGVFAAPGPRGPWRRLGTGLEGREVLSLAVTREAVLAGTDDGIFVWPSAENGWERVATRMGAVDLHPRVTDLAAISDSVYLAATSHGLLRSEDGGQTWRRPALGLTAQVQVQALAVAPQHTGLALAATPLGFFRSVDGGERWVQVSRGIGEAEPHRIAILPTDPRVVFATTSTGLYKSTDHGETWARCTGGIPQVDLTGLAIHSDGRTLYASDFRFGGIYRSLDGGEIWDRLPADGLVSERAWTLAVDPAAPERILAATPAGGLHLLLPPPTAAAADGSF
jgi:photosystem II stability/assembly factor-like uncharacterized protein